jgi:hypothetical protein
MSITDNAVSPFAKTFGAKAAPANDKPKAQFWLNLGYGVVVEGEDGPENRFVSLASGIPLDGQEVLATNSRNVAFAQLQAARNDLHDQLMELAAQLAPGEDRIVQLEVQLRRVNEDVAVTVDPSRNMFARKLSL